MFLRRLLAFCAIAAFAACASHASAPLHGMQFAPPEPAKNFALTDQNGKTFSLAQSRGQAIALYFGFTHCADICPQTLALLGKARARAGLTPAQVRIVMVTVDPRRDSPAALRAFFKKIGVDATGLTGTPAALEAVYRAYGIGVEPQKNDIAHTDVIFLLDPQGRIRETLAPQSSLKDVAADLRAVVD
ncbi:MAG TPA: SCO family protein [Candidatus Baltobacteraceae bacterium]|nr:SCO family protein [Candidatus Baltobacteraceae bacterium]